MDNNTRMLEATVKKLYRRGALHNIRRILQKAHQADGAAILTGFSLEERLELFNLVPSDEKKADIFSYFEKPEQKELLEALPRPQGVKLLSLMDKDDAADLLGLFSDEESKEILAAMVKKDSEEVADLMGYPEDSAGGMMSLDFLAVNENATVAEAIQAIQGEEQENRITFYIYVVNDNDRLVGVASLKQLLLSKKNERLKDIMEPDVISVSLDTHQEDAAKVVEKYDFLSVPVVDHNNVLRGVITVDDVIDVIREEAEENLLAMGQAGWSGDIKMLSHIKARSPWLLLASAAGGVCFAIVWIFGPFKDSPTTELIWAAAAFIPLLLSVGSTTGSQAAAVAVGAVRAGRLESGKALSHIFKELQLSAIFALFVGVFVWSVGELVFGSSQLPEVMAVTAVIQIFLAIGLGSFIPIGIYKLGIDPAVASIPLLTALADVAGVAVFLGLLHTAL